MPRLMSCCSKIPDQARNDGSRQARNDDWVFVGAANEARNDDKQPLWHDVSAVKRTAISQSFCHLSATSGANPCHQTKKARGNKPLTSSLMVGDNGFEPLTLCV